MFSTTRKVMLAFILLLVVTSTGAWQSSSTALAADEGAPKIPLAPGLTWNDLGQSDRNIQLNIKGDALELSGETFQAVEKFKGEVPQTISDFYSNVELYKSGWSSDNAFEAPDGVHRIFYHDSGYYLAVEYLKCADAPDYICVTVWESAQKDTAKFIAGQNVPPADLKATSTFSKKTPADGSTGLNPLGIYLSWSSYSGTEKYSYCVKEGSECERGDPNWTGTFNLGTNITISDLNPSKTYYWQVKAITCYNDCNPKEFVLADNDTPWKFVTTTASVKISGNAQIGGVVLSYVNGGTKTVSTDSDGNYALLVPKHWSGTVTPSRSGYVFSPANISYTDLVSNSPNDDYSAITGRVISGKVGAGGAVLKFIDDGITKSVTANSSGAYSITVTYNWSGTVTPFKAGYTFTPVNRVYSGVTTSKPNQNYTAALIRYTISGSAGIEGATLSYIDGITRKIRSGPNGYYSISVPYNWSGKITPVMAGIGSFTPAYFAYVHVKADASGQDYRANPLLVVRSIGADDGFIVETTKTSGTGGSLNSFTRIFRVGDTSLNQQIRAILSFDTSDLPDNAVIISAKLKVVRQAVVGTNPMITHGPLQMQLKQPYFGASPALELDDFSDAIGLVSAGNIGKTPVGSAYTGVFGPAALSSINTTGLTQIRLSFYVEDNNDKGADYIAFYSGDATTISYRPVLSILYYLP